MGFGYRRRRRHQRCCRRAGGVDIDRKRVADKASRYPGRALGGGGQAGYRRRRAGRHLRGSRRAGGSQTIRANRRGPGMTQPRKTQHNYHFLVPPAQGWQAADSHRLSGQHMSKTRRKGNGIVTRLCQEKDTRAARSRNGTRCIAARTASRRCAIALQVQPTVLRGGVSWLANQQHGGGCRRERTSEQLFIRAAKIFRGSVLSCGRSGLTTLSPVSRSARNARSGMRVFSLTASASRMPARCTRSTAPSWMNDRRAA